jgi:flagellar protein FliJ
MKKSVRLNVIVDLHARQEQDALLTMGRCQQQVFEQQTQLEQLQAYRITYIHHLSQRQQAGMSLPELLEFRAFSDKLDQAIASQHLLVQSHEEALQRARQAWEERHQRTKSLQKVSNQAVAEELKVQNKREQMEQDACAGRHSKK